MKFGKMELGKMKFGKKIVHGMLMLMLVAACMKTNVYAADADNNAFYISTEGKQIKVRMADNAATQELKKMLAAGDLTINMTRNGFEQYGSLGTALPSEDASITAQVGDVLLYNSNTLCVFYGSNRYSYTRIGKIENMSDDELKELLSGKSLTFTLSLNSFGTVPDTGAESGALKFRIMLIAGCAAVIMWVVAKYLRGESFAKI